MDCINCLSHFVYDFHEYSFDFFIFLRDITGGRPHRSLSSWPSSPYFSNRSSQFFIFWYTYFRYTLQFHIFDELKFKDNIGKFNEKHSNIFILIMEKDRFSRKYLSILIANIIGIIGIIIALVK